MNPDTESLQEMAYRNVKEQILQLRLKPGQYVTDTQIAQDLNISRTPVREAFYRLENEGLLVNAARRGWHVYSLSLDDIHHIFDLKIAIEGLIARQAAACQVEALREQLRVAVHDMHGAVAAHSPHDWLNADYKLHDTLFRMVGNKRAERIVLNLNDQWHRLRIGFAALEGRIERSAQEHQLFVDAILAGDAERAEKAMRDHLNQVRAELVRLLVNMVLPFVDEGV
ncbi:MAG: GntR family transcriptional regulator [Chloroflexi bacterium]|nr:GntR family transcriptional regulator [Chloroflexota bacterium]